MGYNKTVNNGKSHSYELPNGSSAVDMKDACFKMGLSSTSVKNLIRKGVIKKVEDFQKEKPNAEIDRQ